MDEWDNVRGKIHYLGRYSDSTELHSFINNDLNIYSENDVICCAKHPTITPSQVPSVSPTMIPSAKRFALNFFGSIFKT
eukprot:13008068-Ditylum_brightwellii.AAC.1